MHNASAQSPVYVLIHSPLVGPTTWSKAARLLEHRGHAVLIPTLADSGDAGQPYWQQHADSAADALNRLPADQPVILVAHSGAGSLLPAISELVRQTVAGYVFVDAGVPTDSCSRLEAIRREDARQAEAFMHTLEAGERYPLWTDEMLAPLIPDADARYHVIQEIRPRGMDFWAETIPVPEGWPDTACGYIHFTESYGRYAEMARERGWPVRAFKGVGHFHMLVDPAAVVEAMEGVVRAMMGAR